MSKLLKYKILEFKKLHKLTFKVIATKCQVTERNVMNWATMPVSSAGSIPSDKLKILADLFDVSMEEMYSNPDLITA
jgi:hypothetical protein